MANREIPTDQDIVAAEILIAAPPERVFKALTDQKQLRQWWDNDDAPLESYEIDPRLGGIGTALSRPR